MPSIAGAIIFDSPAIIAIIGSPDASGSSSAGAAERGGHLGEQVAVGVERAAGPLAAGDDLRLGRRVAGAHHVGDVEPGDAGEVGERQPHGRVDVGLGRAAGGAELGELAGGVPVQRTLALQRLGQVAEHRQRGEEVVGPFLGTGVVGHVSDAKAWSAFASLGPDASPCGSVNVAGVSSASAAVASPEPPTRVHVTGAEGSLARRVLALLAADPGVVDGSATASDVVVHLGARRPRPAGPAAGERHRRRRR